MADLPKRYHCYRCGKNIGMLTPPYEVRCRRCGNANRVSAGENGSDPRAVDSTTESADARLITKT